MRRWITGFGYPNLAAYASVVVLYLPNWGLAILAGCIIGRFVKRERVISTLVFWLGMNSINFYFNLLDPAPGTMVTTVVVQIAFLFFGLILGLVAMRLARPKRLKRGFEVVHLDEPEASNHES